MKEISKKMVSYNCVLVWLKIKMGQDLNALFELIPQLREIKKGSSAPLNLNS